MSTCCACLQLLLERSESCYACSSYWRDVSAVVLAVAIGEM